VFSVESTLQLVSLRGRLMSELGARREGAMSAIIGPPSEVVQQLCEDVIDGVVVVANYNEPTQTVVSGDVRAVCRVEQAARGCGALKVARLKVSGAFHSPLMADAADEFGEELRRHKASDPAIPVLSAVDVEYIEKGTDVFELMQRQLVSPVRWAETVRRAEADGYPTLIEVGPGRVLTGFAKRTACGVEAVTVSSPGVITV
jgi:[acyl-carrier-protein] S-malonyltransferase